MHTLIAEFGVPCPVFGFNRARMADGQTTQMTANLGIVALTWLPFSITALLLAQSLEMAEAHAAAPWGREADHADDASA